MGKVYVGMDTGSSTCYLVGLDREGSVVTQKRVATREKKLVEAIKNIPGQVKVNVDRALTRNLDRDIMAELENIRNGVTNTLTNDNAVSVCEWVLFGNPLRSSTVGPNADYSPGRIVVDT